MDKHIDHEAFDVIVSESALLNGNFGVYGISSDQPDQQVYLLGGFESVDSAIEGANSLILRMRNNKGFPIPIPEDYVVEYRKREDFQLKESYPLLDKDNLVESVSTHINRWFVKITKKTLLKGLLSYENLIFYGTVLVIWIYWTDSTFTVPDLDLPIVGKSLSGKVLDRGLVATYFPIGLFLLYSASFFRMLFTNLSNNELRHKVLVLVKEHSWTLQDFAKLIAVSSNKSMNPWFSALMGWLYSNDLNSITNLLKQTCNDTEGNNVSESKVGELNDSELKDNLQRWVRSEFDQRFHNLLYLDKEKNFRPAYMCFDPIIYLMMNNRTVFRLYSYLKSHGYHVHEFNAPKDPYLISKVMPFAFWFCVVFLVSFLGGVCLWSILIEHSSFGWTVLGTVTTLVVLVLPKWWNYRTLLGSRGFPSAEPIGAYTVGSYGGMNRLSLVGR